MPSLFEVTNGTVCRACGAAHGTFSANAFPGVCGECWHRFLSFSGYKATTDLFNRWLARQLCLSVRRLKVYGVTGRCQAITGVDSNLVRSGRGFQGGRQCAGFASMLRDGKAVCTSHGRHADIVQFVSEPITNPYRELTRLITELGLVDSEFLECVREAVSNVDALRSGDRTDDTTMAAVA